MDVVVSGGVDVQYLWSHWRGTLDEKLQLHTLYEENLTRDLKASVSMTSDLNKGDLKFGFSFTFQNEFPGRHVAGKSSTSAKGRSYGRL